MDDAVELTTVTSVALICYEISAVLGSIVPPAYGNT